MAKTLTYTTEQRSPDLTFATCSHGPDLDPDIHLLTRRAVALRRYYTRLPNQIQVQAVEAEGIVGASCRSAREPPDANTQPMECEPDDETGFELVPQQQPRLDDPEPAANTQPVGGGRDGPTECGRVGDPDGGSPNTVDDGANVVTEGV